MATPTADAYSAPAGTTVYGGRFPAASITLNAPAVGVPGVAASGTVVNNSTDGPVSWALAASAGATVAPDSGTTPAGGSTTFTIVAAAGGAYNVTLANTSGGTVVGSPDTFTAVEVGPSTGPWKYRHEHPSRLLFQRYDKDSELITYTNVNTGQVMSTGITYPFDGGGYGSWVFGPNNQYVCRTMMWPWENLGGDYIDANGVQQGPAAYLATTIASAQLPAGASVHTLDVTAAVQAAWARGKWIALLLKMIGAASSTVNAVGSLESVSHSLAVSYSDGSSETLGVWVAATLASQGAVNSMKTTVPWMNGANLVLEFFPPSEEGNWAKTVTYAELTLRVASTSLISGSTAVSVFLVNPKIPDTTPVAGGAALYPFDAGIESMPGYVIHQPPLTASSVVEDVLDTKYSSFGGYAYDSKYPPPITQHAESQFTPYLWGNPGDPHMAGVTFPTPAQEANLHPARSLGKFVGLTNKSKFSVVHSNDPQAVADGFVPLHPDLDGAMQWTMQPDEILNGQCYLNGNTKSVQSPYLYLPKDKIGKVPTLYMRFYLRFGTGYRASEGEQKNVTFMLKTSGPNGSFIGKYPEEIGEQWIQPNYNPLRLSDRMGKFGGGLAQKTDKIVWKHYEPPTQRGSASYVIVTGGGGYTAGSAGHYGRLWFREGIYRPGLPGPANEGVSFILGPADFNSPYHSIEKWRKTLDLWTNGWQMGATRFGCMGQMYPDRWYCVEMMYKSNTITEYTEPPDGTHYMNDSGYLEDAQIKFWIDGVPAGESPNFAFRSGRFMQWAWQTAHGVPFGSSGAMRPITNITDPQQYMGFAAFVLDFYYGGTAPNPVRKVCWATGLVLSENYIGPMAGVSRANGGLGVPGSPTGADIWINDTRVGEWGEIPGNTPADVNPDNDPAANPNHPGVAPWRAVIGGQNGLMAAWCGMCVDQATGTGWIPNGEGHNDGWSNAAYKWELDLAVPQWVRVKNPSVVANYADGNVDSGVYSDGRPRALHQYNYTEYIPGYGPAVCNEIALSNSGIPGPGRLYLIDEITGDHTFRAASTPAGGSGAATCYDSTRGVVWMRVNGTQPMRYWTPATNTWTSVGASQAWSGNYSLCYMPDSDCILIGNGDNELGQQIAGGWCVFDCATGQYHFPPLPYAPSLGSPQTGGLWPGKCQPSWDSARRCAYAWDMDSGSTRSILRLTPGADPRTDAWTLDVVPVAPTNTVTPSAAQATGTYGRAFYWADKQIFVVINAVNQRGYFFRIG